MSVSEPGGAFWRCTELQVKLSEVQVNYWLSTWPHCVVAQAGTKCCGCFCEADEGVRAVEVQVQALRAVEKHLNLDKLYVLGTNCVDNGPREGLETFLKASSSRPDTVLHYEFMQVWLEACRW